MTTKRLLLVAVLFAFSPIQADEQPAQLAAFQPAVGKWVNSERQRESEDAPWETGTSEWAIRFLPGGLVLETPGEIKIGDDEAVSWAQVWGIDPGSGSPYFHVYVSNGTVVTGSFEWSGRTVKMESAATWRDGSRHVEQCELTYGTDFRTANFVCRRQSADGWWVFREVSGSKSE